MAQLAEWSLLITEVRGSNPVIIKIYTEHILNIFTVHCLKEENKDTKGSGMDYFSKAFS